MFHLSSLYETNSERCWWVLKLRSFQHTSDKFLHIILLFPYHSNIFFMYNNAFFYKFMIIALKYILNNYCYTFFEYYYTFFLTMIWKNKSTHIHSKCRCGKYCNIYYNSPRDIGFANPKMQLSISLQFVLLMLKHEIVLIIVPIPSCIDSQILVVSTLNSLLF